MRTILATTFLISILWGTPTHGSPSSIGVFFDADATDCDATVTQYMPFTVWAYALLGTDAAAAGITGAEFRIDGLEDLVWSVAPNPEAFVSVGNPCQGGCNIAFPNCMMGSGSRRSVLLYTILCIPFNPVSPRTVRVERHTTPDDQHIAPILKLCDVFFTAMFVTGGEARINNGPCTVGVDPAAWSTIKSMFRN